METTLKTFLTLPQPVRFAYTDSEGDVISVQNTEDLQEAFLGTAPGKKLKLFVRPAGDDAPLNVDMLA